ncbi:MAG: hypothetical protein C4522_20690 [Desulfobacteraceae bacterium]|nr:MAG: hypothetical protein C4522_20690 [Desulfobacteraceae bacterium]
MVFMKKIVLITIFCLIPIVSFALDQMKDAELDQVTGRFGASAASDAGALAAPMGDAGVISGDISPAAEPASLGVNAILDGAYANDRQDDATTMTTYFVNQSRIVSVASLGFF